MYLVAKICSTPGFCKLKQTNTITSTQMAAELRKSSYVVSRYNYRNSLHFLYLVHIQYIIIII